MTQQSPQLCLLLASTRTSTTKRLPRWISSSGSPLCWGSFSGWRGAGALPLEWASSPWQCPAPYWCWSRRRQCGRAGDWRSCAIVENASQDSEGVGLIMSSWLYLMVTEYRNILQPKVELYHLTIATHSCDPTNTVTSIHEPLCAACWHMAQPVRVYSWTPCAACWHMAQPVS